MKLVALMALLGVALSAQEFGYVNDNDVRLRDAAGQSSSIIAKLSIGQKVEIVEVGEADNIGGVEDNWLRINTPGVIGKPNKTGWMWGGYISREFQVKRWADLSIVTKSGSFFRYQDTREQIEKVLGLPIQEDKIFESGKFSSTSSKVVQIEVKYDGLVLRYSANDNRLEEFQITGSGFSIINGLKLGIPRSSIEEKAVLSEIGSYYYIEIFDGYPGLFIHFSGKNTIDHIILSSSI